MTAIRFIKIAGLKIIDKLSAPFLIRNYLAKIPASERMVVFGGHWENRPGWLVLNEMQQDITRKLSFPSNSVRVVFLEHVFEHIDFDKAVFFLKEAKRILRKNGILRIISPSIEPIIASKFTGKGDDKKYVKNTLVRLHYKNIDELLRSIGLRGVSEDPKTFFLNGLFRESEHKFIWSAELLRKVTLALGFRRANIYKPGKGVNDEYCIERKFRGIPEHKNSKPFDKESLAVEAIK